MSKLGLGIIAICILLATVAAWKVAKWKYEKETLQCEVNCTSELLKVADQQKEIFITNEKIVIKYKEVEEKNRSLDIIELIDAL
ncbi:MAG: hypothetical protein ACRC6O_13265 [Flavobacterium sp.]